MLCFIHPCLQMTEEAIVLLKGFYLPCYKIPSLLEKLDTASANLDSIEFISPVPLGFKPWRLCIPGSKNQSFKPFSSTPTFPSESICRSVVSDYLQPRGLQLARPLCPWNSPGKNTEVGCHSFLQGIFPTQGSNSGLSHGRQILYHLSHQGSPTSLTTTALF